MYAYTSVVEEYLTLQEAAARLKLKNASGLHHAVRRGLLKTVRRGWMHFTTPEWVDEYAAHVKAVQGGKGKKRPRKGEGE